MMQVHLSCQHLPCVTDGDNPHQLQTLLSSLKNAVRAVTAAQNAFSLLHNLPPETIITISEFITEPQSRESMLELVKMTHICQYLRTTLISFPHLWSSVFMKNNRKELVTASLERSQQVPLDVCLDMEYGNDRDYCRLHGCRCFRESSVRRTGNERNLCSHHTAILPLLNNCYTEHIRKLDVRLAIANDSKGIGVDIFRTALDDLKFCTFSLPSLESFSFSIHPEFEEDFDMHSPGDVFGWDTSPPTSLRHLVLHGYYGGPILSLQSLTSFELAAVNDFYPMEINPRTFLPFISSNTSLVSLTLTHCNFPPRSKLSRVIPIELSQLKTLRLTNISESHSFPEQLQPSFYNYWGNNPTTFVIVRG